MRGLLRIRKHSSNSPLVRRINPYLEVLIGSHAAAATLPCLLVVRFNGSFDGLFKRNFTTDYIHSLKPVRARSGYTTGEE